jgi:hypothetical protein
MDNKGGEPAQDELYAASKRFVVVQKGEGGKREKPPYSVIAGVVEPKLLWVGVRVCLFLLGAPSGSLGMAGCFQSLELLKTGGLLGAKHSSVYGFGCGCGKLGLHPSRGIYSQSRSGVCFWGGVTRGTFGRG